MLTSRFLAAWAAYVVITFAMGFVWHLVLFKPLYRRLAIFSRLEDPLIPLGLTAMLIQGAVLAYIYPLIFDGLHPAIDGFHFGLLMGALMASIGVFAEAGKQRVTSLPTWLVLETTYYLLQFALAGIAIGIIYGRVAL
jgi:hypothetical protein